MRYLRLALIPLVLLVAVSCDDRPAEPQLQESLLTAPSFDQAASGNPNAAFIDKNTGCGLFDGDGNLAVTNDARNVITSSDKATHQCKIVGVPNSTGKAVHYDSDNNPFGPGLECFIAGAGFTTDFREVVSASGVATLTCKI